MALVWRRVPVNVSVAAGVPRYDGVKEDDNLETGLLLRRLASISVQSIGTIVYGFNFGMVG